MFDLEAKPATRRLDSRRALTRRGFLAGTAATGAMLVMHPFSARAAPNQAHLRLMETTDIHVHVFPYDYYADKATDTVGLARTASIIDAIRAEATNAFLFDNGDFLQGNPLGDYVAYERGMKEGDVHPVIKAMNVLKYDAGTLGNHEFNYGLPFMQKVLAGANFPYVCANLVKGPLAASPLEDEYFVEPTLLLEREVTLGDGTKKPIRIGVIGLLPPQIMVWDSANLEGKANTRGIVETARAHIPKLKEAGADIVLALSHSGISGDDDPTGENASLQLAEIDGIDAIFTGHQHLRFPGEKDFQEIEGADPRRGTLHGKPAVMAGFWGSDLGLIDLMLEHDGKAWTIADFSTELRPIYLREEKTVTPTVASDDAVLAAAKSEHEATLTYIRTPVGETSAPLFSYFSLVADDPSVQIVNQAQLWYMADILKATEFASLPLLSAAAPFKAGGRNGPDYYTDIAAGPIAIKNVADLYLYPNTVRAVKVDGATVREWLEMSAGMFRQVKAGGQDEKLLSDDFPTYNFDVIDGVTYRIDVTQPAKYTAEGAVANAGASRIVDLAYRGKPIDPRQDFIVATNNYRAGGGGNFPGLSADKIVYVAPDANRDVIVRYIHDKGTINPSADGNWRFAPSKGTSVVFETGPAAKRYLGSLKDVAIEAAGDGENGFALYRLML